MKNWIAAITVLSTCILNALPEWDAYKKETLGNIGPIPGWCSPEKAEKMMDLIYEIRPKICVEIGVFGGSSTYPTARALNYLGSGRLYCIDPWMKHCSTEGYPPENPHFQWWNQIDHEEIFLGFLKMLSSHQLTHTCAILRMKSAEAVSWFDDESIDILHIDGGNSIPVSLQHVRLFLPKVKKGGYIWFDDCDWPTTLAAQKLLYANCTMLEHRAAGNCLLFQKD
jgi:hypothetical protein